jgi:hypothetical protein
MIRLFRLSLLLLLSMRFCDEARAGVVRISLSRTGVYARISIAAPRTANIAIRHRGDQVDVTTDDVRARFALSGNAPLVVRATTTSGELHLQLIPNASLRTVWNGPVPVIDVFPPAPSLPPASHEVSSPAPPSAADLVPDLPKAFLARLDTPLQPRRSDQQAPGDPSPSAEHPQEPQNPAASASADLAIAATSDKPANPIQDMLLPFSPDVGVASVRRRGFSILYFDEPRPVDLSAFRNDPILGQSSVRMLNSYTVLTIPTPDTKWVILKRQPAGWHLQMTASPPPHTVIEISGSNTEIRFRFQKPGKALAAIDPFNGAMMLIGTDRTAEDGVLAGHRSTTFRVDPSQVGLVIEPISDRLTLRATADGFSLARDDGRDLQSPQLNPTREWGLETSALTRSLNLPSNSIKVLLHRLQTLQQEAADAAPRAKLAPRLRLAEAMLAAGLAREARTVLRVAFADDPAAAMDPHARLASALAETISGEPDHSLLADKTLPLSDELNLWRALTEVPTDPDVAVIRSDLPLLLSYPLPLERIAATLAAKQLLAIGTKAAFQVIEGLPSTDGTVVAKTIASSAGGDPVTGQRALEKLARASDWGTAAEATRQLIALRLSSKQISPVQAADALAAHSLDWRVTGQAGSALMQEAALRREGNDVADAIALWHDAARRYPALASEARDNILQTLADLSELKGMSGMTPGDFVRAADECSGEFASHQDLAAKLAPMLAERLEALDLPARATAVLQHIVDATPPGVGKAVLSSKLASSLLEQGDQAAAQAALDQSETPGVTGANLQERHRLRARLLELRGAHDRALAMIADDQSNDARDLRVSIDEASGRWHDAEVILDSLSQHFPAAGTLPARDADLAIRLATAASHDGDTAVLVRLSRALTDRFPDQAREQTFDLMTAPLTQAKAPSPTPDVRQAG